MTGSLKPQEGRLANSGPVQASLSDAEQHELDELLKLCPDLPEPPEEPVTRAMLDYIEKCDR